jgi:membrane protease YdiL (CAAX protease family)
MATMAQPRGHVSGLYRTSVFLLFVAGGFAIFLFGNNWTTPFPTNESNLYKWSLPVLFGVIALALRGPRLAGLRAIALALFSAALANAVLATAGPALGRLLPAPDSVAARLALDKVAQAIAVVLTLVLLTLLIDRDLGAAFLKRGNLRWGLRFGVIAFSAFAAIFAAVAVLQAGAPRSVGLTASGVPLSTIVAALPWILVFIFTNAFMEELWFRGIFLGKLRPVLGATLAIVATALVFASPHFMAVYVTEVQRVFFVTIAFALGLLNAYVMLKSGSIWGSVLIHAGYDLFVIIPLLAQLG